MALPNKRKSLKILREIEKMEKKGELFDSLMLSKDATSLDKIKYKVCRNILLIKNKYGLTHQQIADTVGTDRFEISKIVNYHIDKISFDKLLTYYQELIESTDNRKIKKAFDKEVKDFLEDKELKFG